MREVPCNDELTEKDRQRIAEDDSIIYVFHSSKGATVYAHDNYLRTRARPSRERLMWIICTASRTAS